MRDLQSVNLPSSAQETGSLPVAASIPKPRTVKKTAKPTFNALRCAETLRAG
ncbi:hypothetical protein FBY54_1851 [Zymomonas mobilis]|nr:hypothetical protein FBY54_1851 [Zymomonas mobilis]